MESVTIKVEQGLAREISKAMSPDYATKTEFIREAIREKIEKIKKDKAMYTLMKNFGASKRKTTDAQLRKIREEVGREIAKEHGLD
jgi:metal-responsive CopG/Arc/MetJ family transcriptional regulator